MKNPIIRTIYLYLFALVGLATLVIGTARIINVGLKAWIFTEADRQDYYYPRPAIEEKTSSSTEELSEMSFKPVDYAKQQQQHDLASAISMIIVGLPLYLYHWSVIKKDNKRKNQETS